MDENEYACYSRSSQSSQPCNYWTYKRNYDALTRGTSRHYYVATSLGNRTNVNKGADMFVLSHRKVSSDCFTNFKEDSSGNSYWKLVSDELEYWFVVTKNANLHVCWSVQVLQWMVTSLGRLIWWNHCFSLYGLYRFKPRSNLCFIYLTGR